MSKTRSFNFHKRSNSSEITQNLMKTPKILMVKPSNTALDDKIKDLKAELIELKTFLKNRSKLPQIVEIP